MVWLALALILLPVGVCDRSPATAPPSEKIPRMLLVEGRQVPVFTSPEEQLAYARTAAFEESGEKAAALQAVEHLFPAAREQSAVAALELAYLALGDDYRLADRNRYLLARNDYLGVLEKYPDLAPVAAKALWYLGWIACDLEGDRQQGIRWFERLATLYPEEKLSYAVPVPWLTIRAGESGHERHAALPRTLLTWTDLAHLEIIRHTDSRHRAWQSFSAIQAAHPGESFTATALKVLVERHGVDEESEQLAMEYLQNTDGEPALQNDLHLVLSAHLRQRDGAPQGRRQ